MQELTWKLEASFVASVQPTYEPPGLTWEAIAALVEWGNMP